MRGLYYLLLSSLHLNMLTTWSPPPETNVSLLSQATVFTGCVWPGITSTCHWLMVRTEASDWSQLTLAPDTLQMLTVLS